MTTIVPATIHDSSLLSRIGSQTLLQSHGHSAPAHVMQSYVSEKFSKDAIAKELSDEKNIFYIIYYDGQAAGYSKIIFNQPLEHIPAKNITKLERLYLLQEYYDLKLGQELLQFNIILSRQNGQAGMWLYVWKENERALRFYTRTGFQIVGDGFFRLTDDHANPNWQMYLEYAQS
jgi:ribosomal protein S18 acetylase RimI-like enzyme